MAVRALLLLALLCAAHAASIASTVSDETRRRGGMPMGADFAGGEPKGGGASDAVAASPEARGAGARADGPGSLSGDDFALVEIGDGAEAKSVLLSPLVHAMGADGVVATAISSLFGFLLKQATRGGAVAVTTSLTDLTYTSYVVRYTSQLMINSMMTVVEMVLGFNVAGLLISIPTLTLTAINLHTALGRLGMLHEGLEMQRDLCRNVVPLLGMRDTYRRLLPNFQLMLRNMDTLESALAVIKAHRTLSRELMAAALERTGIDLELGGESVDAILDTLRETKTIMAANEDKMMLMMDRMAKILQVRGSRGGK